MSWFSDCKQSLTVFFLETNHWERADGISAQQEHHLGHYGKNKHFPCAHHNHNLIFLGDHFPTQQQGN